MKLELEECLTPQGAKEPIFLTVLSVDFTVTVTVFGKFNVIVVAHDGSSGG